MQAPVGRAPNGAGSVIEASDRVDRRRRTGDPFQGLARWLEPACSLVSGLPLLDAGPEAPHGSTDWDRSFLRSLYVTEQKSKLQRSQIAREMEREMLSR
jgi:hypothetical protein